jgi:hypothetical protein
MTINLSHISSWIWITISLLVVFVMFRFFFHIMVRIFHFVISFFWHGCITAIVLLVIYFILRALHIF